MDSRMVKTYNIKQIEGRLTHTSLNEQKDGKIHVTLYVYGRLKTCNIMRPKCPKKQWKMVRKTNNIKRLKRKIIVKKNVQII